MKSGSTMQHGTGRSPERHPDKKADLTSVSMRNIPHYRIDMAAHLCSDGECGRLVSQLKVLKLYREDLGFSVIHPKLLDVVLSIGTYRFGKDGEPKKTIFCLRAGKDSSGDETLIDCCGDHKWSSYVGFGSAAYKAGVPIVVYDASKLAPGRSPDEYRFTCERKLDAVVAVVVLDNI